MKGSSLALLLLGAMAAGCGARCGDKPEVSMVQIPADASSYANVNAFVTKHLVLDLTANFERRTLAGLLSCVSSAAKRAPPNWCSTREIS